MPTNVSEFGGECYAAAYFVQGSRLIVVGTHRSDRAGVREWLATAGHPRSGAYLTPAPGTPPGFYAKPYVADVYYRIDPETGAAVLDGQSRFGDPRPVTEQDGFRGSTQAEEGESVRPAPAAGPHPAATTGRRSDRQHKGKAVRYTGIGLVLMGVVIAMFACVGLVIARPDSTALTGVLLSAAAVSVLAGTAVVLFGGRGYSRTEPGVA